MPVRARLAALVLVLIPGMASLAPSASHAAGIIGPGAIVYSSVGQCTQNFVFEDSANARYVATAGHCVSGVGARVWFSSGTQFGTVVFRRFAGREDYSLIKIDPTFYPDVDPAMRRWGGPTGVHQSADASFGDPVLFHGYGLVYGSTAQTRSRAGVLLNQDDAEWGAEGPILFGDSGGPVLDEKTGEAIGFANYFTLPLYTIGGATTEAFLSALTGAGFNMTLVTAPYTKPI